MSELPSSPRRPFDFEHDPTIRLRRSRPPSATPTVLLVFAALAFVGCMSIGAFSVIFWIGANPRLFQSRQSQQLAELDERSRQLDRDIETKMGHIRALLAQLGKVPNKERRSLYSRLQLEAMGLADLYKDQESVLLDRMALEVRPGDHQELEHIRACQRDARGDVERFQQMQEMQADIDLLLPNK